MSIADSQAKFRANEVDLDKICAEIQARIAKNRHIIFLLQGDIGAGKTTLVKAFAKYVGIKDSVTSPTFSLLHIYSADNSVLGMQFRTCENFGESTDSSLVLSPKFSQIQKPHHNHFDSCFTSFANSTNCDSLRKSTTNQTQNAESSDKIQSKKPFKSFCYFWLLPKVESSLPLNHNLPNSADYADSAESTLKIHHYDLYQKGVDYALDLGLLDLLEQSGIHFVEWGDSQLFDILKNAFENICIISIHKTKNDRIYEFKESF